MKKGDKCKVIKEGASIDWLESHGGSAFGGKSVKLPVGAVITYEGSRRGWGSDPIDEDRFSWIDPKTKERYEGTFSPSSWGSASRSYLKCGL